MLKDRRMVSQRGNPPHPPSPSPALGRGEPIVFPNFNFSRLQAHKGDVIPADSKPGSRGVWSPRSVSPRQAKSNNQESSFACRFAARRSMKVASPLGQGGTSGGFWEANPPRRFATTVAAVRSLANEHQPPPPWPLAPASPPRQRRGAYFQGKGASPKVTVIGREWNQTSCDYRVWASSR